MRVLFKTMSLICCIFLHISQFSAWSQDPQSMDSPSSISLSNDWIHAAFNVSSEARLETFAAGNHHVLWPHKKLDHPLDRIPGISLILYADHPRSGSRTFSLPTSFAVETIRPNSATPSFVAVNSTSSASFAISRQISLLSDEAVLWVTTTVTNTSDAEQTFYPTEITMYNTEFGVSNMPNLQLLFYSPIASVSEDDKGFDVTLGLVNNLQFQSLTDRRLMVCKYLNRVGEIVFTNHERWIALQDEKNGRVWGREYDFLDKQPEPVKNNVILYTNGAGEFIRDGQLHYQNTDVDKYMRLTHVLGRVTLQPGESFTYRAGMTTSVSLGPILDIRDGIVFGKHLEMLYDSISFYVFGAMGIPQEGPVGFQFLNEQDELLRTNYNVTLVLDTFARPRRPSGAVTTHPTVIAHQLGFPVVDEADSDTPVFPDLLERCKKVRLVLLDKQSKQPVRIIDEAVGPWRQYVEAEYRW
jgi:hypothetical protein